MKDIVERLKAYSKRDSSPAGTLIPDAIKEIETLRAEVARLKVALMDDAPSSSPFDQRGQVVGVQVQR
jgi:hypothetical protein